MSSLFAAEASAQNIDATNGSGPNHPAYIKIWEGTNTRSDADITPYLANGCTGKSGVSAQAGSAVIVCPGGSYFWLDEENEGHAVARWLQSNGISAFVLRYRVGGVPAFVLHHRLLLRGNRYPDPQDDLLQAMRYVRAHAREFGVDPERIGAMGFSAGGHLVMSGALFFPPEERPRFVVPMYPVVSMSAPCTHTRSRRALLGDNRVHSRTMRDSLSLEKHVGADCPPVFLANCLDDPTVDYRNSVLLDSALSANSVCHKYLQFPAGGHGFGVQEQNPAHGWKEEFLKWFKELMR